MKVIIVGAGIGGLCAGIALKRLGHDVKIYERAKEVKPAGAAISVWSNGIKCLNYLDLGGQIAEIGGRLEGMAYLDGHTGDTMTSFSLRPLIEAVGQRPYPVSRTELQSMLLREFGLDDIVLGASLITVEDSGSRVTAIFEGGAVDIGDFLIGADGAHSVVRRHVLGSSVERRYAGYVNWNGLVPINEAIAPKDRWTIFVGEGKRVSLMPIAGDRFYFFFDVPLPAGLPNDRGQYTELLRKYFSGWAPQVQALIKSIDPQTTNRVEIHDIDPFMTWAKGRVALLGDAAHNTTPDIGQGGCMAMEDAVVMAMTFQSHDLTIEETLLRYQNRRNERARELVLRARKRCDVVHGADPQVTREWYSELKAGSGYMIIEGISRTILTGPMG